MSWHGNYKNWGNQKNWWKNGGSGSAGGNGRGSKKKFTCESCGWCVNSRSRKFCPECGAAHTGSCDHKGEDEVGGVLAKLVPLLTTFEGIDDATMLKLQALSGETPTTADKAKEAKADFEKACKEDCAARLEQTDLCVRLETARNHVIELEAKIKSNAERQARAASALENARKQHIASCERVAARTDVAREPEPVTQDRAFAAAEIDEMTEIDIDDEDNLDQWLGYDLKDAASKLDEGGRSALLATFKRTKDTDDTSISDEVRQQVGDDADKIVARVKRARRARTRSPAATRTANPGASSAHAASPQRAQLIGQMVDRLVAMRKN